MTIFTSPWLLVLAGRPGTGQTTLAQAVGRHTGTCYVRVDGLETALARGRADVGADGYVVVHELAAANLALGNDVVVDAVNAVPQARAAWAGTAAAAGAQLVLVETGLPDHAEHRRRVESRLADIAGHRVPTWADVEHGRYDPLVTSRDGVRHVVAMTNAEAACAQALRLIAPSDEP